MQIPEHVIRDTVSAVFRNRAYGRPSLLRRIGMWLLEKLSELLMRARVDAVPGGYYVRPAIVEVEGQEGTVLTETFAPILYVLRYSDFEDALEPGTSLSAPGPESRS